MKKLFVLLLLMFLLSGCWNIKKVDENVVNTWTDLLLNKSKKDSNFISLSKYEEEIIKLAVVNWKKELCKKISKVKLCEKIYDKEYNYYKELKCNKLKYLKSKCEDEKNFKERKCEKIKNEYLKRKCDFQKKYDKAIKNKDLQFCDTLPKKDKQKCIQKILTK